jgi:hypothetical protein
MKPKRKCPKCGCLRYRNIGSFGPAGHTTKTAGAMFVIECVRCNHLWTWTP